MDGETLQQQTTHEVRKNSKLQDLQRQESGGEHIWDISEQIQGTIGHHGTKPKGCQIHCFYICGVEQCTKDTPGQSRQGTTPANDVAAL